MGNRMSKLQSLSPPWRRVRQMLVCYMTVENLNHNCYSE